VTLGTLTFRFAGRVAGRLFAFARAEEASRHDLVVAARLCRDPGRAALYLRHASDEAGHARMFHKRAVELGGRDDRRADVEFLFERLGEVRFLAFVHRGEARGRKQFEAYEAFFRQRDEKTARVFARILEDERRHEAYTRELLVELAGSERAARRELARAAAWEAWRTFRRIGRALVAPIYVVSMAVLYALCAPLSLYVRRVRPERRGFSPPPP
jgi:rubrerythrin